MKLFNPNDDTYVEFNCPKCKWTGSQSIPDLVLAINEEYKFVCPDCKAEFELVVKLLDRSAEHRDGAVQAGARDSMMIYDCPQCGKARNRYDDFVQSCEGCGHAEFYIERRNE